MGKTLLFVLFSVALFANAASAAPTIKRCSPESEQQIRDAFDWLENNLAAIDARMGTDGIDRWRGKSRVKLKRLLTRRNLTIQCGDRYRRCRRISEKGGHLLGWTMPLLDNGWLELCTQRYRDQADYVGVIAHELGHLVRRKSKRNGHRKTCRWRCKKPRFAQSLGIAAWHAWHGTRFDSKLCEARCIAAKAGDASALPAEWPLPPPPPPVTVPSTDAESVPSAGIEVAPASNPAAVPSAGAAQPAHSKPDGALKPSASDTPLKGQ